MTTLKISEVFGYGVDDLSDVARQDRVARKCPIRNAPCTKTSKDNPLGICTLSDGSFASSICPVRFEEGRRIFFDAARLAFGAGVRFVPVPEVKILRVGRKKIGKVDFLLAKVGDHQDTVDFAAVEIQAVYFSGKSIRPDFNYYLAHGTLDPHSQGRRPDYRSSAQKRLMPQLGLKVPVFRRWGKKFFVAVDSLFFDALPRFRTVTAANSEITWLTYPIQKVGAAFVMQDPVVVYSTWDDVATALREGEAPEPSQIVAELTRRIAGAQVLVT
jgi:hypothetical protein